MIEIAVAFAAAEAAVAGVKKAIALGKEVQECYHEISTFFQHQGEIQAAAIQQEHEKKMGRTPQVTQGDATKQALDATFAARRMFRMEIELKEMLIYQSNEAGLYEEMCQRRDAIILEVKERIEEEARQVRMAEAAKKRKREERLQNIQEWCAVVLGVSISSAIMWVIFWMFRQGGEDR
jgi:Fe2+ transport system protein B